MSTSGARPPQESAASPAPRSPRWRGPRAIEAAVIALFVLLVAWPWLRPDRHVLLFDTVSYTGANLEVTNQAWRSLAVPDWNDTIFGGVAHLANAQVAAFNPLKVPFVWMDTHRALELMTVVNLFVLAFGFFTLLAWRLRVRPPAALVGTVIVLGSGAVMARSIQFEQISVVAWAPWLLVAIDWVVAGDRPRARAVGCGAVATALVLVAGHPQQVYILTPLFLTWAIVRMADLRSWRRAPALALTAVLGIGLAAVQLLPTALQLDDAAALGTRSIDETTDPSYSVQADLLAPTFLGDVFESDPVRLAGGFEPLAFVGAAAVVLAVLGLVHGLTSPGRRWTTAGLALVAGAAMVLSFGPTLRPYRTAFGHVPGFDLARVPGRWVTLVVIAVALLAALGLDAAARRALDRTQLAIAAGMTGVGALGVIVGLESSSGAALAWWLLVMAVTIGLAVLVSRGPSRAASMALIAIAALVVVELGLFQRHSLARSHQHEQTFTELESAEAAFLADSGDRAITFATEDLSGAGAAERLRPNANALYGIRSLDGYDGGTQVTDRWATMASEFGDGSVVIGFPLRYQVDPPLDPDLLARYGVRWVVVGPTEGYPSRDELVADLGEPVLEGEVFDIWENPAFESEAMLYLGATPDDVEGHDAVPAMVSRPAPDRLEVVTEGEDTSVLAVAEQYDDGWTATVDGRSVDVFAVDDFRLGVEIPAGAHEVRFAYTAPGLRVGAAVSLLALAVVVLLIIWPAWCGGLFRTIRGWVTSKSVRSDDLATESPQEIG